MTAPPKVATNQKRTRNDAHHRALMIPKVQKLVSILRKDWAVMGAVERGQRINELTSLGCSGRGLGRDLGVSATSIRRHKEIAGLPESDRRAIDAGASAKSVLMLKVIAERQRREQLRIDEDRKTGALSDDAATTILEFCRLGKELRKDPMIRAAFPILLDKVGSHIRDFEVSGHRAVKVSKKLESRELFRKTRPRGAKNTPASVHQAVWLAEVVWLITPESPIRASAMLKARRRAGELLWKMTPIESWKNARLNSQARLIELYNLPPRKFYPGGARSMQRQGRPAPLADPKR